MNDRLRRLQEIERWIAWIRLFAVPFAALEVGLMTTDYPSGYEEIAWAITGVFAVGALLLWILSRRGRPLAAQWRLGITSLVFDTGVVVSFFVLYYAFEVGTPIRLLLFLPIAEAAVRFGLVGGIALPLVLLPALAAAEWLRAEEIDSYEFSTDGITFPFGVMLMMGLIVGWLERALRGETERAEARAAEAEVLRDQLGRRADQLEAVNRVARALSSTLDQEQAFQRFLREVQSVFHYDRLAIVLAEADEVEVMANSGVEEDLFPRGTRRPLRASIMESVLAGETVVRGDMDTNPLFPEERDLAAAGLRSRVVAPLNAGGRIFGMVSVSREQADAFTRDEVDLVTLLGRQIASAVQNIRTYAAERSASEELRRLSALRADFVSLVSHELRAPMASIIGCATTLRERWRELQPDQRESFLALIADETTRLSTLIGDVLDTSRIEAGTFSYVFSQLDLAELVRETAAMVELGHDEISVRTRIDRKLPLVEGDRERLRQLLVNLLTNAAKYTVVGDEIEVRAESANGLVTVSVRDHGPGIPSEQQALVFEKFGRLNLGGKSKPGAGLGLFIARSIAEAHGGSLELESERDAGATFTLRLPVRH